MRKLVAVLISSCFVGLLSYFGFRFYQLKNTQSYFDNLDEALKDPAQVQVLIIRNQGIDSLPNRISELVNIRVLNVANNHLKQLPESIGRLYNLEELSVENNQIRELPASVRYLKRLKVVNLCVNSFGIIPAELSGLDSLHSLGLSKNKIEKVNMMGFRALEDLDLSENNIIEVSSSIRYTKHLKKLDLYSNKLETLPAALFSLPLLNELILSGNPLDENSKKNCEIFLKSKAAR